MRFVLVPVRRVRRPGGRQRPQKAAATACRLTQSYARVRAKTGVLGCDRCILKQWWNAVAQHGDALAALWVDRRVQQRLTAVCEDPRRFP